MHDHQVLIFTALMVFLFGLVSKASERWLVTGPMVFVAVGVLVSSLGLDLFTLRMDADTVKLIAEITLMLILFVDASLLNYAVIRKAPSRIHARLLGIGLPLTMALGFAIAALLFDYLSLWGAALVALVLSPTDAALGQAVVKSDLVPDRIRQSISMESGLNDGIALPPILVCFAALGGRLIELAAERGWMEHTFQRLSALSLALLSFALAESVEGNGFIAAFSAGLALGVKSSKIRERIQESGEAEGLLLSLGVFLLFGLAVIPTAIDYWGWTELLYAIASLTVIRMVPVAVALIGTRLDPTTVLFIGWFGPRGIASVLYLLLAVSAIGVAGHERLLSLIVLTVTLSILLHGVSAVPFCKRYGSASHEFD